MTDPESLEGMLEALGERHDLNQFGFTEDRGRWTIHAREAPHGTELHATACNRTDAAELLLTNLDRDAVA